MKKKKIIIAITATVVLVGGAVVYKKNSSKKPPPIAFVERQAIKDYKIIHQVTSVLQPVKESYLSLRYGGKLGEILVKPGTQVKAGQSVAVVDKAKRVADLERAFSNYELARTDLVRIRRLLRQGAATRQELDDAKNRVNVTKTELKNAKQDLEDAVVRSPLDGMLSFFVFNVGDFIPDGSRVAVVEDRSTFKAVTKLPFELAENLNDEIKIKIKSYNPETGSTSGEPEEALARLTKLGLTHDYKAGKSDVEFTFAPLQTFNVGEPIMISLVKETFADVEALPTGTLLTRNGKDVVLFKQADKDIVFQPVEVVDMTVERAIIKPLKLQGQVVKPNKALQKSVIAKMKDKNKKAKGM